jgi:predicted enzyme involved in methoxymalonyl-ACP biosynthesis
LLSCRVLGRSIDSGMLSHALELARQAGAKRIRGRYVASAKNEMVRDLYARHGFRAAGVDGDAQVWEADLSDFDIPVPAWARVRQLDLKVAEL